MLEVHRGHLLWPQPHSVDQPLGKPVRYRIANWGWLRRRCRGEVHRDAPETFDDTDEPYEMWLAHGGITYACHGGGVDLGVASCTDRPYLANFYHFLLLDDSVDDAPCVPADHEFPEAGELPTERMARLHVRLEEKNFLQHPDGGIRTDPAQIFDGVVGEEDLRSHLAPLLVCRQNPRRASTGSWCASVVRKRRERLAGVAEGMQDVVEGCPAPVVRGNTGEDDRKILKIGQKLVDFV